MPDFRGARLHVAHRVRLEFIVLARMRRCRGPRFRAVVEHSAVQLIGDRAKNVLHALGLGRRERWDMIERVSLAVETWRLVKAQWFTFAANIAAWPNRVRRRML